MATLERLVVELATDASDYDKGLAQTSKKTSSWGGPWAGRAGTAAWGAAAAAGAAIVGVGVAGVKEFIGFQNSMNEVFTLLPGLSKEAMGDMSGDVKKFAKEFGVLPKDTVPALYQAISAGVPKENVFQFLETAQKAAKGGVTDLETAVDGISSVINAYGTETIGAAKASDMMFTAVKLGKTTYDELAKSLFNVVPTAAGLGVKFGDVTAALAAMTAKGTPTSVATTQLRQLLIELSKAGTKTSDAFQQLSGKDFQTFIADGGNLQGALQIISGGLTTTSSNADDVAKKMEKARKSIGRLSGRLEVAKLRQSEFNDKTKESVKLNAQMNIDKLTGQIADLEAEMAGATVTVTNTNTKMTDMMGSVEAGSAALQLTGDAAGVFASNLDAMGNSTGATEGAFDTMSTGLQTSIDKIKASWNVMLLDVGEKAAPAFEALTGVAETALPVIGQGFVWVAEKAAEGVQWIKDNWPQISETVMKVFIKVKGVIKKVLGPALEDAQGKFSWVTDWIDENLPLMRKTVETVLGAITKFWDTHGTKIKEIVGKFMGIVSGIFDTQIKNAFDIVKATMLLLTGDFEGAGETLKGIAVRTWETVLATFQKYIDLVKAVITGFDWKSLGLNIINGIWGGITGGQGGGDVGETVGNAVSDLWGGLFGSGDPEGSFEDTPQPEEGDFESTGRRRASPGKALKKEFAGAFDFVGPTMAPETALDFASSRSSGFDALGKNVFNSRDMIAGLRHAGAISVRIAETATAELAALRAEVAGQNNSSTSSNTSGQTNYFTFNITAGDEAEARTGVLNALRDAGVAF